MIRADDLGSDHLNQGIWTTMSYNIGSIDSRSGSYDYGWQGTPMTFDIAAIQHLYGANRNYATGNDIYRLPTTQGSGSYYAAIWDTDGIDTIAADHAIANVTINLNEAPLTGANAGGYISSVAGISGGFTIANQVTIENAIGGFGHDSLIGNGANNNLSGRAGDDRLTGSAGDDILFGGAGNDILNGSNPHVYNSGSGEYDRLTGGIGADVFVLGDADKAYYRGLGYANINDFDWHEGDKIQVFGSASYYSLQEDTFNGGIRILYQGYLISYVSNTTDVRISNDFIFV